MPRFDGSLAMALDFGDTTVTATVTPAAGAAYSQRALRLAPAPGRLTGPDKYRILERRRREAQIRARHLLDLLDRGHPEA
jgi:hypothetical protein